MRMPRFPLYIGWWIKLHINPRNNTFLPQVLSLKLKLNNPCKESVVLKRESNWFQHFRVNPAGQLNLEPRLHSFRMYAIPLMWEWLRHSSPRGEMMPQNGRLSQIRNSSFRRPSASSFRSLFSSSAVFWFVLTEPKNSTSERKRYSWPRYSRHQPRPQTSKPPGAALLTLKCERSFHCIPSADNFTSLSSIRDILRKEMEHWKLFPN